MSGLLGFVLELLSWTQKESDQFRGLLGCGGRLVKRSIWGTGGCRCRCGRWGWVTLCNHIFYLFFSLREITVASPCTPSILAKRLTALKADAPFSLAHRWGSGSLGLTWFLFEDTGQCGSRWFTPWPQSAYRVGGRRTEACLGCCWMQLFKFCSRNKSNREKKSSVKVTTCYNPYKDLSNDRSGQCYPWFPVNNDGCPEQSPFLPVNVHQEKPTGTEFHYDFPQFRGINTLETGFTPR